MKKLAVVLSLVSLTTMALSAPSFASTKKRSRTAASSVSNDDTVVSRADVSGLASDRSSSLLGKIELSAQAGTTFAAMTAGVFSVKTSYKLPLPTLLYGEAGLGAVFNSNALILPLDFGARFNIRLSDMPQLQPFLHVSLGPAFATSGKSTMFHMFTGPGLMYRMARYDLRFDMGLVMFSDQPGFQFTGGVAL